MAMRLSWIVLAFVIMMAGVSFGDEYRSKINEGYDLYKNGQYDKAAQEFKDASILKPDKALPAYDKGTALYKSNDYEGAAGEFLGSVSKNEPDLKADALYNTGNAYYKAGKLDQAVKSYIDALKLQPKDKDYKHNLEMALMKQQQQQQNKDQKDNKDQKKQDQQKQDQQKQDQQKQDQQQQDKKQDQNQQKNQPQQQKEQMTQQQAQELLARFADDEKDIQKRLKQVNVRGRSLNDW
jgi:tetratricopeptide (TPR) repeat protein